LARCLGTKILRGTPFSEHCHVAGNFSTTGGASCASDLNVFFGGEKNWKTGANTGWKSRKTRQTLGENGGFTDLEDVF